jgi:hypothetical protein
VRGGRRDRGEGAVNYIAVILLVAAVAASVVVGGVPGKIAGGISTAVCRVAGDKDCDQNGTTAVSPPAAPSGGRSTGPAVPVPGSSAPAVSPTAPGDTGEGPGGTDPNDPAEREFENAIDESGAAQLEAGGAEGEFGRFDEEIKAFLADLIGFTDAENCLTKGDIGACLMAAAGVVPWGKAFKILKSIPKAYKLWKRFKSLWDRVSAARRRNTAATTRLEKALRVCATGGANSFVPGTSVLLADGSRRPIEDVAVGDRVWATDPERGRSGPRAVTALITGAGRKNLVDITVDPDGLPGGPRVMLTATDRHPFWVANAAAWVDARDLSYGDTLVTPDGGPASVVVTRERSRALRVYNLTVGDLHTYYVEAGTTPVLVHNAACFNMTPLGGGSMRSPAGLVYNPGSVHGHRLRHLLAHGSRSQPDPSKLINTQFKTYGRDLLQTVDKAWAKRGKPTHSTDRIDEYVIDMGEEVGTRGERFIKIIVEKDSNRIVTAHPTPI